MFSKLEVSLMEKYIEKQYIVTSFFRIINKIYTDDVKDVFEIICLLSNVLRFIEIYKDKLFSGFNYLENDTYKIYNHLIFAINVCIKNQEKFKKISLFNLLKIKNNNYTDFITLSKNIIFTYKTKNILDDIFTNLENTNTDTDIKIIYNFILVNIHSAYNTLSNENYKNLLSNLDISKNEKNLNLSDELNSQNYEYISFIEKIVYLCKSDVFDDEEVGGYEFVKKIIKFYSYYLDFIFIFYDYTNKNKIVFENYDIKYLENLYISEFITVAKNEKYKIEDIYTDTKYIKDLYNKTSNINNYINLTKHVKNEIKFFINDHFKTNEL